MNTNKNQHDIKRHKLLIIDNLYVKSNPHERQLAVDCINVLTKFNLVVANCLTKPSTDINAQNNVKDIIFHNLATYWPDALTKLENFLKSSADIRVTDENGNSLTHLLALCINSIDTHKLIAKYPKLMNDINARNNAGDTPLHLMMHSYNNTNYMHNVTSLIKMGANINAINNLGNSPLHILVECKPKWFINVKERIQLLESLISLGADINALNNKGQSILRSTFNAEMADFILNHKSFSKAKFGQRIIYILFKNNFRTRRVYRECSELNDGFRALISAAEAEHLTVQSLKKPNSKNTFIQNSEIGQTPTRIKLLVRL